jgi:hypothetical protein
MKKFTKKSRLKSLSLFVLGVFLLQGTLVPTGAASEFIAPDEVKNVKAETGDGLVKLSWDGAIDSDGVVMGYKIYWGKTSVQDVDDVYDDTVLTNSTETSYTMRDLENGVTYYFSVTALDDEENESETYSLEVEATPSAEVASEAPYMVSAEQVDRNKVAVKMSKPVRLLAGGHSFSVQRKAEEGYLDLEVVSAEVNGEIVHLTLLDGMLAPENTYVVTATSTVEDLDGVPVSSGVVDSVEFYGLKMEEPSAQIEPQVEPEPFLEPSLPQQNNHNYNDNNQANNTDDTSHYHQLPAADTTPPLDATGLAVDTTNLNALGIINISWIPAVDRDEDIIDQVFYVKEGTQPWDNGYSIGKDEYTLSMDVKKDRQYQVKVVTVDKSGNKSTGAMFSFATTLNKSGASGLVTWGILGMILLLSFGIKRVRL